MSEPLRLAAGDMVCIDGGRDVRVHVLSGKLIATRECDPEDNVLGAGSSFAVASAGKTIVQARTESVVQVVWTETGWRRPRIRVKKYVGPRAVVLRELALA